MSPWTDLTAQWADRFAASRRMQLAATAAVSGGVVAATILSYQSLTTRERFGRIKGTVPETWDKERAHEPENHGASLRTDVTAGVQTVQPGEERDPEEGSQLSFSNEDQPLDYGLDSGIDVSEDVAPMHSVEIKYERDRGSSAGWSSTLKSSDSDESAFKQEDLDLASPTTPTQVIGPGPSQVDLIAIAARCNPPGVLSNTRPAGLLGAHYGKVQHLQPVAELLTQQEAALLPSIVTASSILKLTPPTGLRGSMEKAALNDTTCLPPFLSNDLEGSLQTDQDADIDIPTPTETRHFQNASSQTSSREQTLLPQDTSTLVEVSTQTLSLVGTEVSTQNRSPVAILLSQEMSTQTSLSTAVEASTQTTAQIPREMSTQTVLPTLAEVSTQTPSPKAIVLSQEASTQVVSPFILPQDTSTHTSAIVLSRDTSTQTSSPKAMIVFHNTSTQISLPIVLPQDMSTQTSSPTAILLSQDTTTQTPSPIAVVLSRTASTQTSTLSQDTTTQTSSPMAIVLSETASTQTSSVAEDVSTQTASPEAILLFESTSTQTLVTSYDRSSQTSSPKAIVLSQDMSVQTAAILFSEDISTQTSITSQDRNTQTSIISRDISIQTSIVSQDISTQTSSPTAILLAQDTSAQTTSIMFTEDISTQTSILSQDTSTQTPSPIAIVSSQDMNSQTSSILFSQDISAQTSPTMFSQDTSAQVSSALFSHDTSAQTSPTIFSQDISAQTMSAMFSQDTSSQTLSPQPIVVSEVSTQTSTTIFSQEISVQTSSTLFSQEMSSQTSSSMYTQDISTQTSSPTPTMLSEARTQTSSPLQTMLSEVSTQTSWPTQERHSETSMPSNNKRFTMLSATSDETIVSKEERRSALLALRARQGDYDDDLVLEQLARTRAFLTDPGLEKLRTAFIIVVGCGGVGSHVIAALARSGVSKLRIIDFDQVTLSSLNRHAVATLADVGTPKVQCIRKRLEQVTPWIHLDCRNELFSGEVAASQLEAWGTQEPTYVVDAIDNIDSKVDLLYYCYLNSIPVISSMGAGCKSDPTRLFVGDISASIEDPLSRATRRRLRMLGVKTGIPVVFSTEKSTPDKAQLLPLPDEEFEKGNIGELGVLPDFRVRILPVLGTMPAMFGLCIANHILLEITDYPHDYLQSKGREKMYENILGNLQALEERLARWFGEDPTGLRIPVSLDDVGYLVEEVYRGRSVVSGLTTRLALIRWGWRHALGSVVDRQFPGQKFARLALDDLVCMTKEEAVRHEKEVLKGDKSPEDMYEPEVIQLVDQRMEEELQYEKYR